MPLEGSVGKVEWENEMQVAMAHEDEQDRKGREQMNPVMCLLCVGVSGVCVMGGPVVLYVCGVYMCVWCLYVVCRSEDNLE